MDFINYQSPSEDTLEFFLNPTKASNTERKLCSYQRFNPDLQSDTKS